MKTTIKRILSCTSVLAIFIFSNISVQAKLIANTYFPVPLKKSTQTLVKNDIAPLILFEGSQITSMKVNSNSYHYSHTSHYSHSSHVSHHSHYSSGF